MNLILRHLKASAAKHEPSFVRSENARETPPDMEEYPDVPYTGEGGAPLAADIYRPADPALRPLPTAVVIHGGGLFVGTRKIDRSFCQRLSERGFLVISVEYRLIDEANACEMIADVCAGFDFAHDALKEYGGDPNRVFIIGESAGAYLSVYATAVTRSDALCGMFGITRPRLEPAAYVGLSGMFYTTRRDFLGMAYRKDLYGDRRKEAGFLERMNPGHPEVVSNLPPVLLTSSRGDFLRKYTLRFAQALKDANHPCELIYYPEGKHLVHAFPSLNPSLPESVEVMTKIVAWLNAIPPARGS
ncbi:MAG: alpha/beta hydrolase [Clostridia bacterium]|nr:alpha/beta hydrolase [Clostridia bacterium]